MSQWGGGKGEEYMNEHTDRMRTNGEYERGEMEVGETAFIRFNSGSDKHSFPAQKQTLPTQCCEHS